MTTLTLQETTSDGTPTGEAKRYTYHEIHAAISLRCPRMNAKQLRHYVDLACAAVGHPVDVTHWERGALMFSARLVCVKNTRTRVNNHKIITR